MEVPALLRQALKPLEEESLVTAALESLELSSDGCILGKSFAIAPPVHVSALLHTWFAIVWPDASAALLQAHHSQGTERVAQNIALSIVSGSQEEAGRDALVHRTKVASLSFYST